MATELFDIDSIDSVTRKVFQESKTIKLSELDISTYKISEDYITHEFFFNKESYRKEIADAIEPILKKITDEYEKDQMFTAVYECVLNAYQHGNKMNPNIPVKVAHKIDESKAKILVIDQGEELEKDFTPFILRHKEGRYKTNFIDYYTFSGKEKPDTNLGTGTSFMHTYVDSVKYFKSEEGGLLIRLRKDINKNK